MDPVVASVAAFVEKWARQAVEASEKVDWQGKFKLLEAACIEVVDTVFAPRQVLKQLVVIAGLQASILAFHGLYSVATNSLEALTERGRKMRKIRRQLTNARSYEEWLRHAEDLDKMRGYDKWRQEDNCLLYDVNVLRKRLIDIQRFLDQRNLFTLIFRLRGGLTRDQFGMQHVSLYSAALAGTKHIAETYHQTVCNALNFICDTDDPDVPTDAKLAFFNETRHSYGRTALLLSGGAFLGYYHVGVVKSLIEQGLMPRVISGSSAGSLITAIVGVHTDDELLSIMRTGGFRKDFFGFMWNAKKDEDKDGKNMLRRMHYMVPQSFRWIVDAFFGLIVHRESFLKLDINHLKTVVLENVGHYTFQEAFDRTGRIINITVAPQNKYDPPRLLNYLTAPHVCVWSAAVASCAIPGLFDSISLVVREPSGEYALENEWTLLGGKQTQKGSQKPSFMKSMSNEDLVRDHAKYSDGSIENDLPMQQLSELFNVDHFIVSQVNPHSFFFSTFAQSSQPIRDLRYLPLYPTLSSCLNFLKAQCREWLRNVVNFMSSRSDYPVWSYRRGLAQALTQDYMGRDSDISVFPWAQHLSAAGAFLSLIKNPTDAEFYELVEASERSIFPHLSRIRSHCMVELTLDKCVQRLRRKLSSEEAERAREQLAHAHSAQAVPAAPTGNTDKRDRTPSFYTSRSLLNLSGLSVADPPALPPPNHAAAAAVSGNAPQPQGRPQSMSEDDYFIAQPSSLRSAGGSSDAVTQNIDDFFTVVGRDGMLNDEHVPPQRSGSPGRAPHSPAESTGIKKSTSMAKFYYKNSSDSMARSSDSLKGLHEHGQG